MLLDITHETRYQYAPAVELSRHVAHLRPLDGLSQDTLNHRLEITPTASEMGERTDPFGNLLAHWAIYIPHQQLRVCAQSRVRTRRVPAFEATQSWETVADHFQYRAGQSADSHASYTFVSSHVPRHRDLSAYARESFTPQANLVDAANSLMDRIHRDFVYDSHSTDIGTPTLTAFTQRRGVCQDFAHIMLACLRSLGLAARYVSGYLLTHPAPGQSRLIGSDASHAWISMDVPEATGFASGRWFDLDPTNNRSGWASPGEDYVHLATGRDFADVSPLRGVLQGGTRHTVEVGVTVQPVE